MWQKRNYPGLHVQLWWHPLKSGFRSEIFLSLISQLKSLVPAKLKSLVLGYLAIDQVQNKRVGVTIIQLTAGLPGIAMLCPLAIALLVRMLDKASISSYSLLFWFLPFSACICLSFSPSLLPFSISFLPNTFFSQQNMTTHLSPLDNSEDNQENAIQYDWVSGKMKV